MAFEPTNLKQEAEALIKKVSYLEFGLRICRAIASSLLLLLSLAAFLPILHNPLLNQIGLGRQSFGFVNFIIIAGVWIIALYLLVRNLKQIKFPSRNLSVFRLDEILARHKQPAISFIDDEKAAGDKQIWALLQQQISEANLANLKAFPKLEFQDKIISLFIFLAFALCLIDPKASFDSLKPDISPMFGDYEIEASAWASPPSYIGGANIDISQENGKINLEAGSIVEVHSFGSKGAPILHYGNYQVEMITISRRHYFARVKLLKSDNLRIDRFGTKRLWHINIMKDKPPVFSDKLKIDLVGNDRLALSFTAHDDHAIKKAALVLEGRVQTKDGYANLNSIHPFDAKDIKSDGVSNFIVETGYSPLIGNKVRAYVILEDSFAQRSHSGQVKLTLPNLNLSNPISQAAQEIRLAILRETKPYKRFSPSKYVVLDEKNGESINIETSNPIFSAPRGVKYAFDALSAILIAPEDAGIDGKSRLGLINAKSTLTYSRTLADAQRAADILWEVVDYNNQTAPSDTKTQVTQAIENLKNALKNGASEEQIDQLRQELNQAIEQHINSIAEQSGESGDMEVEGHDAMGQISIDGAIDDAKSLAQSGDIDGATQRLDELENQLNNLSKIEHGDAGDGLAIGGQSPPQTSNSIDDLLQEQRDIADETQKSGTSSDLAQRQEQLRQRLSTTNDGQNSDYSSANDAMQRATNALKNNDKNGAQNAQNEALNALRNIANSMNQENNDNQDPLGRETQNEDNENNGISIGGGQTKIPQQIEQRRARTIFERLQNELQKNQQDNEQRKYLEELINPAN